MSANDYLFRPIPGPYRLSAHIRRSGAEFLFRLNPAHEAVAVTAVRERQRVVAANEAQSS